ncbi:hypothetical protein [Blastococcus sp. URHD0036]|uniref:hypothetical protein n=1 Tax=Blastococcus sp. URHD0036 TaxID=1380356 RepID=UPI0012DF2468|nr:hypothetical protein [Blastococcus sp. URHD0036]
MTPAGIASGLTAVATLVVERDGEVRTLDTTGVGRLAAGPAESAALGAVLRELTAGIRWLAADPEPVPACEHRDDRVRALGERMACGFSVLVAVLEPASAEDVAELLAAGGADTTTTIVGGDGPCGALELPDTGRLVAIRSDAVVMQALESPRARSA